MCTSWESWGRPSPGPLYRGHCTTEILRETSYAIKKSRSVEKIYFNFIGIEPNVEKA